MWPNSWATVVAARCSPWPWTTAKCPFAKLSLSTRLGATKIGMAPSGTTPAAVACLTAASSVPCGTMLSAVARVEPLNDGATAPLTRIRP